MSDFVGIHQPLVTGSKPAQIHLGHDLITTLTAAGKHYFPPLFFSPFRCLLYRRAIMKPRHCFTRC